MHGSRQNTFFKHLLCQLNSFQLEHRPRAGSALSLRHLTRPLPTHTPVQLAPCTTCAGPGWPCSSLVGSVEPGLGFEPGSGYVAPWEMAADSAPADGVGRPSASVTAADPRMRLLAWRERLDPLCGAAVQHVRCVQAWSFAHACSCL